MKKKLFIGNGKFLTGVVVLLLVAVMLFGVLATISGNNGPMIDVGDVTADNLGTAVSTASFGNSEVTEGNWKASPGMYYNVDSELDKAMLPAFGRGKGFHGGTGAVNIEYKDRTMGFEGKGTTYASFWANTMDRTGFEYDSGGGAALFYYNFDVAQDLIDRGATVQFNMSYTGRFRRGGWNNAINDRPDALRWGVSEFDSLDDLANPYKNGGNLLNHNGGNHTDIENGTAPTVLYNGGDGVNVTLDRAFNFQPTKKYFRLYLLVGSWGAGGSNNSTYAKIDSLQMSVVTDISIGDLELTQGTDATAWQAKKTARSMLSGYIDPSAITVETSLGQLSSAVKELPGITMDMINAGGTFELSFIMTSDVTINSISVTKKRDWGGTIAGDKTMNETAQIPAVDLSKTKIFNLLIKNIDAVAATLSSVTLNGGINLSGGIIATTTADFTLKIESVLPDVLLSSDAIYMSYRNSSDGTTNGALYSAGTKIKDYYSATGSVTFEFTFGKTGYVLGDGEYIIEVGIMDEAGNRAKEIILNVYIDRATPQFKSMTTPSDFVNGEWYLSELTQGINVGSSITPNASNPAGINYSGLKLYRQKVSSMTDRTPIGNAEVLSEFTYQSPSGLYDVVYMNEENACYVFYIETGLGITKYFSDGTNGIDDVAGADILSFKIDTNPINFNFNTAEFTNDVWASVSGSSAEFVLSVGDAASLVDGISYNWEYVNWDAGTNAVIPGTKQSGASDAGYIKPEFIFSNNVNTDSYTYRKYIFTVAFADGKKVDTLEFILKNDPIAPIVDYGFGAYSEGTWSATAVTVSAEITNFDKLGDRMFELFSNGSKLTSFNSAIGTYSMVSSNESHSFNVEGTNASEYSTPYEIKVDSIKPVFVFHAVTESNKPVISGTWVNEKIFVTPYQNDMNVSGISFFYRKAGDTDWITLQDTVQFFNEENAKYEFKAESGAGITSDISDANSFTAAIDYTANGFTVGNWGNVIESILYVTNGVISVAFTPNDNTGSPVSYYASFAGSAGELMSVASGKLVLNAKSEWNASKNDLNIYAMDEAGNSFALDSNKVGITAVIDNRDYVYSLNINDAKGGATVSVDGTLIDLGAPNSVSAGESLYEFSVKAGQIVKFVFAEDSAYYIYMGVSISNTNWAGGNKTSAEKEISEFTTFEKSGSTYKVDATFKTLVTFSNPDTSTTYQLNPNFATGALATPVDLDVTYEGQTVKYSALDSTVKSEVSANYKDSTDGIVYITNQLVTGRYSYSFFMDSTNFYAPEFVGVLVLTHEETLSIELRQGKNTVVYNASDYYSTIFGGMNTAGMGSNFYDYFTVSTIGQSIVVDDKNVLNSNVVTVAVSARNSIINAGKYNINFTNKAGSTYKFNINLEFVVTPAVLTITKKDNVPVQKTYDGTRVLNYTNAYDYVNIDGLMSSDSALANSILPGIGNLSINFKTANHHALTIDGADMTGIVSRNPNYVFNTSTLSLNSLIDKATLTLSTNTANKFSKFYDGTNSVLASEFFTNGKYIIINGIKNNENVTLNFSDIVFADVNAGNSVLINISGLQVAVNGSLSNNYSLAGNYAYNGKISRRVLSNIEFDQDKVKKTFDGKDFDIAVVRATGLLAADEGRVGNALTIFAGQYSVTKNNVAVGVGERKNNGTYRVLYSSTDTFTGALKNYTFDKNYYLDYVVNAQNLRVDFTQATGNSKEYDGQQAYAEMTYNGKIVTRNAGNFDFDFIITKGGAVVEQYEMVGGYSLKLTMHLNGKVSFGDVIISVSAEVIAPNGGENDYTIVAGSGWFKIFRRKILLTPEAGNVQYDSNNKENISLTDVKHTLKFFNDKMDITNSTLETELRNNIRSFYLAVYDDAGNIAVNAGSNYFWGATQGLSNVGNFEIIVEDVDGQKVGVTVSPLELEIRLTADYSSKTRAYNPDNLISASGVTYSVYSGTLLQEVPGNAQFKNEVRLTFSRIESYGLFGDAGTYNILVDISALSAVSKANYNISSIAEFGDELYYKDGADKFVYTVTKSYAKVEAKEFNAEYEKLFINGAGDTAGLDRVIDLSTLSIQALNNNKYFRITNRAGTSIKVDIAREQFSGVLTLKTAADADVLGNNTAGVLNSGVYKYVVTAQLKISNAEGSDNYEAIEFVSSNINISKKSLLIRATAGSKTYDGTIATPALPDVVDARGQIVTTWPGDRNPLTVSASVPTNAVNAGIHLITAKYEFAIASLKDNYTVRVSTANYTISKRVVYLKFKKLDGSSFISEENYSANYNVYNAYGVEVVAATSSTGFIGNEGLSSNKVNVAKSAQSVSAGGMTGFVYTLTYADKVADETANSNYIFDYAEETKTVTMYRVDLTIELKGYAEVGDTRDGVVVDPSIWNGFINDPNVQKNTIVNMSKGEVNYVIADGIETLLKGTYTDKIMIPPGVIIANNSFYNVEINTSLEIGSIRVTVEMTLRGTYGDITANGGYVATIVLRNHKTGAVVDGLDLNSYTITLPSDLSAGERNLNVTYGTLSSEEYTLHTPSGLAKLIIDKRNITITVDANTTKQYDTADPVIKYTVSAGDFVAGDSDVINITRTAGETLGRYAMSATAENQNYSVAFANVETDGKVYFEIVKRELTLNFKAVNLNTAEYMSKLGEYYAELLDAVDYTGLSPELIAELKGVLMFIADGNILDKNARLNVGDHLIKIIDTDYGNFIVMPNTGATSAIKKTITKKAVAVEVVIGTPSNKVAYGVTIEQLVSAVDGYGINFNIVGVNDAELNAEFGKGVEYAFGNVSDLIKVLDAGSYVVSILNDSGNFEITSVITKNITIAKRDIKVVFADGVVDNMELEYSSKDIKINPTFLSGEDVLPNSIVKSTIVYIRNGVELSEGESPRLVGSYVMKITLNVNNYTIASDSLDTLNFKIVQKTLVGREVSGLQQSYTGNEVKAIVQFEGNTSVIFNIVYKQEIAGTWTAVQPVNVGSYKVFIVVNDENYKDVDGNTTMNYEIDLDRNLIITPGDIKEFINSTNQGNLNKQNQVYNPTSSITVEFTSALNLYGLRHIVTINGVVMNDINKILTNVGEYIVKVSYSSDNFSNTYEIIETYEITPATLDAVITVPDVMTYDALDQQNKISAVIGDASKNYEPLYDFYFKNKNGVYIKTPEVKNAGDYKCVVKVNHKNYVVSEATATKEFSVGKRLIGVEIDNATLEYVYDGTAKSVSFKATSGGTEILIVKVEARYYLGAQLIDKAIEVGEYKVVFFTDDANNYVDTQTIMKINTPRIIGFTVDGAEFPYDGEVKTLKVSTRKLPQYDGDVLPSDYYEPRITLAFYDTEGNKLEGEPFAIGEYIVEIQIDCYGYELYKTESTLKIVRTAISVEVEREGTSLKVAPVKGAMYRISDGKNVGEWQESNEFTIKENGKYFVEIKVEGDEAANYTVATAKILSEPDSTDLDLHQIIAIGALATLVVGIVIFIILMARSKVKVKRNKYDDDDDDDEEFMSKKELKKQRKAEEDKAKQAEREEAELKAKEEAAKLSFTDEMKNYFEGDEEE